jgi:hypothetical protein
MVKNATTEMIERYVYAVTCSLPKKIRDDVAKELESLINDMIEARCGDISPTQNEVAMVLTELGTPMELTEKYDHSSGKGLITGLYYTIYKQVLKIVLPLATLGICIGNTMRFIFDSSEVVSTFTVLGAFLGGIIQAVFMAFSVITIIFAVFAFKKIPITYQGDIYHLPPVPTKRAEIKPSEPIGSIITAFFGLIILMSIPEAIGCWFGNLGWVSLFDIEVFRKVSVLLVLSTICGVIRDGYKLSVRRYTKKLSLITIICNVSSGILCALTFLNPRIINASFIGQLRMIMTNSDLEQFTWILDRIGLFLFAFVIFGLVIDVITTTYYQWKYDLDEGGKN